MIGGCGGGGGDDPKLEEKNALQFEDLESYFGKYNYFINIIKKIIKY